MFVIKGLIDLTERNHQKLPRVNVHTVGSPGNEETISNVNVFYHNLSEVMQ